MSKLFVALGILLLLLGVALFLGFGPPEQPGVGLPSATLGADDVIAIPPDKLNQAVAEANAVADSVVEDGIRKRAAARWFLFAVFVAGSLILISAGVQKLLRDLGHRETWLTVVIGLLGTLSAASSYAAGYLEKEAATRFACVDTIEKEVRDTVQSVKAERDAQLARQYLSEMGRSIQKCSL